MACAFLFGVITLLCVADAASDICRGTHCSSGQDWGRLCAGEHCAVGRTNAGATPRQFHHAQSRTRQTYRGYQQDAHAAQYQAQSAPLVPYTIIQPQPAGFTHRSVTDGTRRTNPRTITAEVFHPGCAGGICPTGDSQRPASEENASRECKGFGCKLPLLVRQKSCVGNSCPAVGGDEGRTSPVHVTDRAAQFLDELPDFGSDLGGSPAGIQLTCDLKPSSNEVPSEDALVLQLQLSKGQEKLVEALRGQQEEIRELQRILSEQQGALVNQQREIVDQQRRMLEQMEQVKGQYNILMDSIKQTSLENLQGELDSHMETLSGQMRAHHTEQALALHKVDMEASIMEVGRPLLACGSCSSEEYCGFSSGHPRCERCTVCPAGFFLVAQCSVHADRICQDRDECLEIPNLCGDPQKCLNTPVY
ncbi:uncharacterized protein LOC117521235 [Thalassophryne amazonica]|uniref:uncharacterized protein LOC117521235 n=1 Tax=Thalassophryne amazonica TaxID=390379 RepID=UPI00147235B6|nr:uncharacterized protein LOC117521235 [Thalassophryne amazonica]